MDQVPELVIDVQNPSRSISQQEFRIASKLALSDPQLIIRPFISPQDDSNRTSQGKPSLIEFPAVEPLQLVNLEGSSQTPTPHSVSLSQEFNIDSTQKPVINSFFRPKLGIVEEREDMSPVEVEGIVKKALEEISNNNIKPSIKGGNFTPLHIKEYEKSFQNFSGTLSLVELNTAELKKTKKLTPPPTQIQDQKNDDGDTNSRDRSPKKSNRNRDKQEHSNSLSRGLAEGDSIKRSTPRNRNNESGPSSRRPQAPEETKAEVVILVNPPNVAPPQPNREGSGGQNQNNSHELINIGNNDNQPAQGDIANSDNVIQINAEDNGINILNALNDLNNNQAANQGEAALNGVQQNDIIRSDIRMKLRTSLALFACIIAGASMLQTVVKEDKFSQKLFVVIYCYLAYIILEEILKLRRPLQHRWHFRELLFSIFDCIGMLALAILFNLKIKDIIDDTNNLFLYQLGCAVLYLFFSEAPKSTKESQTIARIIITIQIFLLTGKVDANVSWNWHWVLIFVFVYLGIMIIYMLLLGLTLILMTFLVIIGVNAHPNMSRHTQFIGVLWNFSLNALALVALLCIIGANKDDGKDMLLNCLKAGQNLAIFLLVFTIVFHQRLIEYLVKFTTDAAQRANSRAVVSGNNRLTVKMEKAKHYFVMLSPTYFVQLKDSFIIKDKEKLQKIKKRFQAIRAKKYRSKFISQLNKFFDNAKIATRTSLVSLKRDKEIFDFRFEHMQGQVQKPPLKKHIKRSGSAFSFPTPSKDFLVTSSDKNQDTEKSHYDNAKKAAKLKSEYEKLWLSEGDITGQIGQDNDIGQEDENGGICYICCTKTANAVMIDCGHGGVCYECATEFLVKKGQCMECRTKVTKVVKVDTELKMKNIVVGYELGVLKET